MKDNGHANFKLDDVVQVLIPKHDRAKTDRHCLVGVVVEVQEKNSTCRIAVKGGVLDRCIAYQYLKQLPPNSNNVRLHDLETELESWRGLPTMSLRKASRMQSMVGGQGFSKCNCRGKCDNKRCGCRRKGLYCTARCHKREMENAQTVTQMKIVTILTTTTTTTTIITTTTTTTTTTIVMQLIEH